jgi:hypothetical protein
MALFCTEEERGAFSFLVWSILDFSGSLVGTGSSGCRKLPGILGGQLVQKNSVFLSGT